MAKSNNTQTAHRSSVDGRFVTETYAKRHPNTTQREQNPRPSSSPSKGGKK